MVLTNLLPTYLPYCVEVPRVLTYLTFVAVFGKHVPKSLAGVCEAKNKCVQRESPTSWLNCRLLLTNPSSRPQIHLLFAVHCRLKGLLGQSPQPYLQLLHARNSSPSSAALAASMSPRVWRVPVLPKALAHGVLLSTSAAKRTSVTLSPIHWRFAICILSMRICTSAGTEHLAQLRMPTTGRKVQGGIAIPCA